jgi:hypothetical protein
MPIAHAPRADVQRDAGPDTEVEVGVGGGGGLEVAGAAVRGTLALTRSGSDLGADADDRALSGGGVGVVVAGTPPFTDSATPGRTRQLDAAVSLSGRCC